MVLYFVCYALSRVCGIIYNYSALLRYIIIFCYGILFCVLCLISCMWYYILL